MLSELRFTVSIAFDGTAGTDSPSAAMEERMSRDIRPDIIEAINRPHTTASVILKNCFILWTYFYKIKHYSARCCKFA